MFTQIELIGFVVAAVGILLSFGSILWGVRKGNWLKNPEDKTMKKAERLQKVGLIIAGVGLAIGLIGPAFVM